MKSHQSHHAAKDTRLGAVHHMVAAAHVQHQHNNDDNEGKTAHNSADNQTN